MIRVIVGSEHELYGALRIDNVGIESAFEAQRAEQLACVGAFLKALNGHYGACFASSQSHTRDFNAFTLNGFRFYRDLDHLEIASPECASARDLLKWEKAGEAMLELLIREVNRTIQPNRLILCKKNCDFGGNSFGAHESYQLTDISVAAGEDRLLCWAKYLKRTVPFFASSPIVTGAGHVNGGTHRYLISHRGAITAHVVSDSAHRVRLEEEELLVGLKPIFMIRGGDADLVGAPHCRIQVVFRDGNMADWSIYLKYGVTRLILRMLQEGFFQYASRSLAFESEERAVIALNAFSSDPTGQVKARLFFRGDFVLMTALEIQKVYLEWAESFAGKNRMTAEEMDIIRKWRFVLWALENDAEALEDKLDYKIKEKILNRSFARYGLTLKNYRGSAKRTALEDEWRMLDLAYHDLSGGPRSWRDLAQRGAIARIATDKEIAFACANPPPNTRAAWRGAILKEVKRMNLTIASLFWNEVGLATRSISPSDLSPRVSLKCETAQYAAAALIRHLGLLKICANGGFG
ncbi:MAG: proteasome accessory factor PafA2 family protein [Parcubacteria group bacterium]|nr:proteasome accessory factor PafA2 family protein [Parcubacteria group bacterium]